MIIAQENYIYKLIRINMVVLFMDNYYSELISTCPYVRNLFKTIIKYY